MGGNSPKGGVWGEKLISVAEHGKSIVPPKMGNLCDTNQNQPIYTLKCAYVQRDFFQKEQPKSDLPKDDPNLSKEDPNVLKEDQIFSITLPYPFTFGQVVSQALKTRQRPD